MRVMASLFFVVSEAGDRPGLGTGERLIRTIHESCCECTKGGGDLRTHDGPKRRGRLFVSLRQLVDWIVPRVNQGSGHNTTHQRSWRPSPTLHLHAVSPGATLRQLRDGSRVGRHYQ